MSEERARLARYKHGCLDFDETRPAVYCCKCCRDEILVGDEYWDIPNFGVVCQPCIKDAHHWEAELFI